MRWRWWRREQHDNGEAARAARAAAERKLRAARQDWPKVHETRDLLAARIEEALRGRSV